MQWLTRLPSGPIITANFDRVLEMVFTKERYPLNVISGRQVTRVAEALHYRTNALLKIHGDVGDAASSVLTKTSYDRAYSRWLRVLLSNLATTPLLFLGCSLSTDRTIRVLEEAVRQRRALVRHFALLALPETEAELRKRNARLSEKANIDVIWYPAPRHEFVEHVLAYLCSRLPPEKRRSHKDRKRPRYQDIPDAPFTLFGRDSAQLVSIIESSRIVCVEGDRGVGKTAFALHALRKFMNRDTFDALVWITAAARKKKSLLLLSHVLDDLTEHRLPVQTTDST